MLTPIYSALTLVLMQLQARIDSPLLSHFILNYSPLLVLDVESEILKTWGAFGLVIVILSVLGRVLWVYFKDRQKRADDLSDTMIGSLKVRDLEHGPALKLISQVLESGLDSIKDQLERSEVYKREIDTRLEAIQLQQRQHNFELQRQWTFILSLTRLIPAKDERRKMLSEGEIQKVIRTIKEEFPNES